ncbi:MAG: hypothetical protein FDX30_09065 [Chlorobium sp.]|nr:MAG: hypothetical protein FDX30_09065 [Chlorobium sp.]
MKSIFNKYSILNLITLLGFIALLTACNKVNTPIIDKDVSIIKDGVLKFDNTLTVGQAFDNYKYFNKVQWNSSKSENGRRIVTVIANIDLDKANNSTDSDNTSDNHLSNIKHIQFKQEFIINVDNTFNAGWYGVIGEIKDGTEVYPEKKSLSYRNIALLKKIYDNEVILWSDELIECCASAQRSEIEKKIKEPLNVVQQAPTEPQVQESNEVPAYPLENETKINDNYTNIIRSIVNAEDSRNIDTIIQYYSDNMTRYWDITNPKKTQLINRYQHIWGITSNSKNNIQSIEKIDNLTYLLNTIYTYQNLKQNRTITQNSVVRYVFGDDGKIIEVYGQ